jgi:hypothetical protein
MVLAADLGTDREVALASGYDLGRDQDWEWGWCRRSRVMSDAAAVGGDLRGWLLGYGLVALVGVAAWAQRNLRIRQFADEERDVPLSLATRHWYRAALAVAVTAFGLLGWLLYEALGLASAQLAVAVAGLAGVVVIIASSVPMWNEILRYARGEPITGRSGRASRTQRS